jgi:hypothetical protein
MSINLEKQAKQNLINHKKKASLSVKKAKLGGQKAKVALALDYSGSMRNLYKNGVVQRTSDRLLALASQFDDDGSIEVFLFSHEDHEIGCIDENNFYDYIDKEIYQKYKFGRTEYAGVMKRIVHKYFPSSIINNEVKVEKPVFATEPVFVIFITDGNNSDRRNATNVIKEASKLPIFWQFVGIGNEEFPFLQRLDELTGRFIDNANFFHLNDLDQISEEILYERLLNEFPVWLKLAREKGLL